MATYDWPSDLADVIGSNAIIREPGLKAWYGCESLPDIPDAAAGITYKSNWLTGVDGWTGVNCTLSAVSGRLQLVATTAAFYAFKGGNAYPSAGYLIRARVRLTVRTGAANNYRLIITSNGSIVTSPAFNLSDMQWHTIDHYFAATGFVVNLVGISAEASGAVGDTLEIDEGSFYVGTGEYDYPLIDGSGNANHAKVYRALPIQDTLGQMLRFNVFHAYATIPSTSELAKQFAKVGGIVGASFWVRPLATAGDVTYHILGCYDSANNNRFYVRFWSRTLLQFLFFNQTLAVDIPCATNELAHITVVRSGVDGKGYAWKNGVRLTPVQQTAAVAGAATEITIGSYFTGLFPDFDLFGLRFFDFLPTDAQAMNMYLKPSYYEALPSAPLQNGYQETKATSLIRTDMDVGPVKTRRRYTAVPRYYDLQYQLTWNQKQILEDFHDRLCAYGSLPFNWTNPLTGEVVEARFVEPPSFAASSHEYLATVRQEVLP